jgi:hypothetical protein
MGEATAHETYHEDYATTDYVTELVWASCVNGLSGAACDRGAADQTSWTDIDADDPCVARNVANDGDGYWARTDWRLPSGLELLTIADYTVAVGIDPFSFPGPAVQLWSWQRVAAEARDEAYILQIGRAPRLIRLHFTTIAETRCVAGTRWLPGEWITLGDGTVLDEATGLIWQRCVMGRNEDETCSQNGDAVVLGDWVTGLGYCEELMLAGHSDWRLPNVNELMTTQDHDLWEPAVDTSVFPMGTVMNIWSSTTDVTQPDQAFYGSTNRGGNNVSAKLQEYHIRCVRGPR